MEDIYLESIRKQLESCNNAEGFMFYHSIGGGTGSGIGSLLLELLSREYPKIAKLNYTIFPSLKIATSIVEIYNAILTMN